MSSTATVKTFADPETVADAFAAHCAAWLATTQATPITIALSGGTTPKLLFTRLATQYADKIDWSRLHFFWGDERCVPPTDPESNFQSCKERLLDHIDIPSENIHRIMGESDPAKECDRYEEVIRQYVGVDEQGFPRFDLMLLGMGDDGHTASIFPDAMQFLTSDRICEVATHPVTGQQRITLTGRVINHASQIVFLVTGSSKASVLAQVIHKTGDYVRFPASHVVGNELEFYIDHAAAARL